MTAISQMQATRSRLNQVDETLVETLIERFRSIKEISSIKKLHKLPCRDRARESEILDSIRSKLINENWEVESILRLFRCILKESVAIQLKESRLQPESDLDSYLLDMLENKPYRLASRLHQKDDSIVKIGTVKVGGKYQVVIAGPCAVESEQQIFACAREVKLQGGHLLRGGCFKPRSSPYSFQGMGEEGLKLLRQAGDYYSLPVVTEVMSVAQIDLIAQYSDVLQVGARNMQNFDLLKALGQCRKPIILKRGMMATIDEWLASAEYIMSEGNMDIILCERGIRSFDQSTRNTLDISAVPVIKEHSHLPIILDPSHASGKWRYIIDLAKAAMAINSHGIMVEIHPRPQEALSDGPQSLKFSTFEKLMTTVDPWLQSGV